MPQEFAHNAIANDDGVAMTAEQRLELTLTNPSAQNALSLRSANAITKARISYALAELAQMNMMNAHNWLQRVAEVNPRQAFELYLQLLEFSTPKLKAVEVTQNDGGGKPMNEYTLAELQRIAAEKVVSSQ